MNPQNVVRLRQQLVLVCCLNTSVLLDSDSATRLKPTGEIKKKPKEKKKDQPMKNISYKQHLEEQVTNPWHTEIRLQRASVQALDGGLEVGEQSIGWLASSRVSRLSC